MDFIEIQYAYGRRQKSLKTTTTDPYCKDISMEIRVIQYVHGGCKPFTTHNSQLQVHCGDEFLLFKNNNNSKNNKGIIYDVPRKTIRQKPCRLWRPPM